MATPTLDLMLDNDFRNAKAKLLWHVDIGLGPRVKIKYLQCVTATTSSVANSSGV
jgi:hypothetical protein